MDRDQILKVKADLSGVHEQFDILAILLFGSHASGDDYSGSDIDICVVSHPQGDVWDMVEKENTPDLLKDIWSIVGDRYDLYLFVELPFHMKVGVIENHQIIVCDDIPLLYEYFYQYHSKIRNYKNRLRVAYGRE